MRSVEELYTVMISTFEVLFQQDAKARLRGSWIVHIPRNSDTTKYDKKLRPKKICIKKDVFDRVVALMSEGWTKEHEETKQTAQSIRGELKRMGLLLSHNEYIEHNKVRIQCVSLNFGFFDWMVSAPLKAGEKGEIWRKIEKYETRKTKKKPEQKNK